MQVRGYQMLVLGVVLCSASFGQDNPLVTAIKADLKTECSGDGYSTCVLALRYHGQGLDVTALELLQHNTGDAKVKEHYKLGQSLPKEGFWNLLVELQVKEADCDAALAQSLLTHLTRDPKALGEAADDAGKNKFLALSDLLSFPPDRTKPEEAPWIAMTDVYRYCFAHHQDDFFAALNKTLGRSSK